MTNINYPIDTVQNITTVIRKHNGYYPGDHNNCVIPDDFFLYLDNPEVISIIVPRFKTFLKGLFGHFWFSRVAIIQIPIYDDYPQWFVKSYSSDRELLSLLMDIQKECQIPLIFI